MRKSTKLKIFRRKKRSVILSVLKRHSLLQHTASKQIKQVMIEKNIKVGELADRIGMKPQPLSNKLFRDTMSFSDVEQIAAALGCDVKIVDRETGKEF